MSIDQREAVRLNSAFHTRFRYPWRPHMLTIPTDPGHETRFLNQAIGAWDGERLPRGMRIWVAGCGTNQAVLTALRFPEARIIATDISPGSLEASRQLAAELGVENITFMRCPIEAGQEPESFHYVICTGVVHHNVDVGPVLAALARALRPEGVLELMVYNCYHRIETGAFQQAMRILAPDAIADGDLDTQMQLALALTKECPLGRMRDALETLRGAPEEMIADALLQPIELSFTVDLLETALREAGMRLAAPCVNQFDVANGSVGREMRWEDPDLCRRYATLDDVDRWALANRLLLEKSPMIWFYVERTDAPTPIPPVRHMNESFLARRFIRARTDAVLLLRDRDGHFRKADARIALPSPTSPTDAASRAAFEAMDPALPMRHYLDLAVAECLASVDDMRQRLTTPMFSYLQSVAP